MTHRRTQLPVCAALFAASLFAAGHASAGMLVDGGFDALLNATSLTKDSSSGWYTSTSGGWIIDSISGHDTAASRDGRWKQGIGQMIVDNGMTTGVTTVSYDYTSYDADSDNNVVAEIFGTNVEGFSFTLSGSSASDMTKLATDWGPSVSGTEKLVGWSSRSFTVDLGETGYKYLVIGIKSNISHESDHSDYLAVDNVAWNLTVPEPASLSLLGAGLLLIGSRRKRSQS